MYNRYIRNDMGQYQRIPVQDETPPPPPPPPPEGAGAHGPGPEPGPGSNRRQPPPSGAKGFLGGILEKFNLKDLDSGDLLLLFILFLLLREGEDEELLIALGLLLIL